MLVFAAKCGTEIGVGIAAHALGPQLLKDALAATLADTLIAIFDVNEFADTLTIGLCYCKHDEYHACLTDNA